MLFTASRSGEIVLKDVCFSYTEDREILHNVSITIPKKGFVGIVGESGSGKSTIASLIMGRNIVDRGNLTIDGKEINTTPDNNGGSGNNTPDNNSSNTTPDSSDNSSAPKTGDSTGSALAAVLMMLSAAGAAVFAGKRKKETGEK